MHWSIFVQNVDAISDIEKIPLLENKKIRTAWDEGKQDDKEGSELVTKCNRLKLVAEDGKRRATDVADMTLMFRIIESIPSKKAEPIKVWMAQVAAERILDLGGELKFEGMKSRDLICDPVEYLKADLAIQGPGVELLMKCMEGVKDDPITYDLLKDYLRDEEEDLFWSQGAVELIEKIDARHWLRLQL